MSNVFVTVMLPAFGSGLTHVVSGPDHLTAILNFSTFSRSDAFFFGLNWGIGHSIGIGLVATIVLTVGAQLSRAQHANFDYYGSLVSGLFLILLGVYFLFEIPAKQEQLKQKLFHLEDTRTIGSPQTSNIIDDHQRDTSEQEYHTASTSLKTRIISLLSGIATGIAGPGGVLAIMPASYYPTYFESVLYILFFMVSSTLMMGIVAFAVGELTYRFAVNYIKRMNFIKYTYICSSVLSITVGCIWIILTFAGILGNGHS
jgi:hypothetical protein